MSGQESTRNREQEKWEQATCRLLESAFQRLDPPTRRRLTEGTETDLGKLPPLKILIADEETLFREHYGDRRFRTRSFEHAARRNLRSFSGMFEGGERCRILLRQESTDEHTVVHELCHAALHFDPEKVTRSWIYRGSPRVLHALDDLLERHHSRQIRSVGLTRREVRRYRRIWKKSERGKTLKPTETALEKRVRHKAPGGFVSAYALIGYWDYPEGLDSEEFFVECWAAFLFSETSENRRKQLEQCDPVMFRVIEEFVALREREASAEETIQRIRPLLEGAS